MHPRILFVIALLGICSLTCPAQDRGYWNPASSSASSITGDVAIYKDRATINLVSFTIVRVRDLTPAEAAAAFDADINAGQTGTLYHLNVPATQRFAHKNTLCGTESTQWMATFVTGKTMQVAFFSGPDTPVFSFEALRSSPDLCGTYSYAR